MKRNLTHLPSSVLKHILSYLTYEEVANLRLVGSHNIRKATDLVLNSFFLSLPNKLEQRAKDLSLILRHCRHGSVKWLVARLREYRLTLVLLSEVRVLGVLCGRYVAANLCTFAAGSILDAFVRNSPAVSLFLRCERYMDYFDQVLEPYILHKNHISAPSRYGIKIIDILDCYYNCNFHLTVSQDGPYWQCTGKYESVSAAQITKPPVSIDTSSDPEVFKNVVHYIRNTVRWNNLLYCIEMSLESIKEVAQRNVDQFGVMYKKTEGKILKQYLGEVDLTKPRMCVTLNISNTNELVPVRLQPCLAKTEGHHTMHEGGSTVQEGCKFVMELEVHHEDDLGRLRKTVIHICQENTDYIITHNSLLLNTIHKLN